MIYIYNCYGGTHSSTLAASYHLNKLPTNKPPTKEEILNLKYFNTLTPKDMGKIFFHGKDDQGDLVYTIGRGRSKEIIPAMRELLTILSENGDEYQKVILSNTSPSVPWPMTFGGLFSRRLHIDFIGIPLLIKGAQQTHNVIVSLVDKTKEEAKNMQKTVEQLENKEFKVKKSSI